MTSWRSLWIFVSELLMHTVLVIWLNVKSSFKAAMVCRPRDRNTPKQGLTTAGILGV